MENKKKLVIVSNVFSHHQKPLADSLYAKIGEGFAFVETLGLTEELKNLGYEDGLCPPYLYRSYAGQQAACRKMILEADAVVFGGAPESVIRERIRRGKLLFRCSERPLKHGVEAAKYLPRFVRWHARNPAGKPIYMLCASGFTAGDYGKFGLFRNRCYRWGYFPPTKRYDNLDDLLEKKDPKKILWCGRFLELKHVEDALQAAKGLKDQGIPFSLELVGTGVMEQNMRGLQRELQLEDCVRFLGSMTPEGVRERMEHAGIYLVSSDRQEGWGAVVNEAMNSACALLVSHAVGSAPFLLRPEENGLLYPSRNVAALCGKLKILLTAPERQKALGREAYRSITEEWNAETAAQRLLALADAILAGDKNPELFESGPGSKAEMLQDDWFCG